jgi:exoribonuclease-2
MAVIKKGIPVGASQSHSSSGISTGKIPAKGSSKETAPQSEVGQIVQYDDDGGIALAIIIGQKKDKLLLVNDRGREIELGKGRLYVLPKKEVAIAQGAAGARSAYLEGLRKKIEDTAGSVNIEELWSFLREEVRTYSVAELSELYLGSNEIEQHAGLRIGLIRERIHFKRDKDGFEPRSEAVVDDLKKAEVIRQRQVLIRERTIGFFKKRMLNPTEPIPEEAKESIRLLSLVAANAQHLDASHMKEAKELIHSAGAVVGLTESGQLEKSAFVLLEKIKFFDRNTNLPFIRHDIPVEHDAESLAVGESIPLFSSIEDYPESVKTGREDFTGVKTFTIDDESTRDMDDALSLEQTVEGYTIGIHITDVASIIPDVGALETSAARRATSIYCADGTVHMLPPALSQEKLSLREGVVRPTLSCLVHVSHDFKIQSYEIKPLWIKSSEKLSYNRVDELLEEGDQRFLTLHEFSVACEDVRNRNGAMRVHKREVVPHLEEDGTVSLQEIDEDSPSRALVAEMMVLANSLFAEYASQHGIPILFRCQEKPDEEPTEANGQAPVGPARDFGSRVKMKKSTVGIVAQPHAGLGVKAYSQLTSPIRRYMDLCHQRQLLSFMQIGRPWLEASEFEELSQRVEVHLQAATLASRETRRFWLLRYLEQRPRSEPIAGTVVRTDLKSPLIELDEVFITLFARAPKALKLGDRVTMKISAVEPHTDYVRLEIQ